MRVLHLTRDYPPHSKGGISTAVAGLARASAAHGVDTAVLSFDGWRPRARPEDPAAPTRERDGLIDVMRVNVPSHLEAALAAAEAFGPDVLHVHHGMLFPFSGRLRRAEIGTHTVFTVHVWQAESNRLRGLTERTMSLEAQERALAAADVVTAPSMWLAEQLGAVPTPLAIGAAPGRATGARSTLLAAGRFGDLKGTAELFELIRRALSANPHLDAVVAGGLPDNAKGERRWLQRFADETPDHLSSRVRFPGWLSPAQLGAALDRAALFISPSRSETFGLSVLEAMARGVTVVASDLPPLRELIDGGRTGTLVPPGEFMALEAVVGYLLSDSKAGEQLGRAAADAVRDEWLWPQRIGAWLDAYG